ncbi:MAG TPA: hypothetical protein VHM01_01420 [Alphaproteobacteria bacterium]|nr:hypothetical protein [Alphaproteobacteria bacterium]
MVARGHVTIAHGFAVPTQVYKAAAEFARIIAVDYEIKGTLIVKGGIKQ